MIEWGLWMFVGWIGFGRGFVVLVIVVLVIVVLVIVVLVLVVLVLVVLLCHCDSDSGPRE